MGTETAEQRKEKILPAEFNLMPSQENFPGRAIAVGTAWISQRWLQYLPITNIPSTVALTADGATAAWRPWAGATSGHRGKRNTRACGSPAEKQQPEGNQKPSRENL